MPKILDPRGVAEAIRDTLAGRRTKVDLGRWAFLKRLSNDRGELEYDATHQKAISEALYTLMFLEEGEDYFLDGAELRTMLDWLDHLSSR